jgi:hypothetical protein
MLRRDLISESEGGPAYPWLLRHLKTNELWCIHLGGYSQALVEDIPNETVTEETIAEHNRNLSALQIDWLKNEIGVGQRVALCVNKRDKTVHTMAGRMVMRAHAKFDEVLGRWSFMTGLRKFESLDNSEHYNDFTELSILTFQRRL